MDVKAAEKQSKKIFSKKVTTELLSLLDLDLQQDKIPTIILNISPCRSGSTVLLRVFSAHNILSIFQPFKNILRWHMRGEYFTWSLFKNLKKYSNVNNDYVFIKETLGPYYDYESFFNPLNYLIAGGYPAEKILILLSLREPLTCWASWKNTWNDRTNINNFIHAYYTTNVISEMARELKINCIHFVYENIRDYEPKNVVFRLFKRIKIKISKKDIQINHWDKLPKFGSKSSNIIWPEEPKAVQVNDVHENVKKSKKYSFIPRDTSILSDLENKKIKKSQIQLIYNRFKALSKKELKLK